MLNKERMFCISKRKNGMKRFTVGKSYNFEEHNSLYVKCKADESNNYEFALLSKESLNKHFIVDNDTVIGYGRNYYSNLLI